MAECLDFGSLAGGFGGDQAAAFGGVFLVLDGGHEGTVLEFAGYQGCAADGGADPLGGGVDQDAVETEPGGVGEVGGWLVLLGGPVGPVAVPAEVVQQRPLVQLGGGFGSAALGEQLGAADGEELFLVEGFFEQGVPALADGAGRCGLAGVGDPGVEVAAARVDAAVVGFQFDRDAGVGRFEGGEPGGQPSFGDGFDGDDPDAPGPAAVTLRRVVDVGEDPFHVFQVSLPVAVQVDAPLVAVEQLGVQVLLERPDPVADRRGGDTQLGCGVFEALVAGRGLEEAPVPLPGLFARRITGSHLPAYKPQYLFYQLVNKSQW